MKIKEIYNRLNRLNEGKITFLEADGSFQLLIGVILSAQTTDKQVNQVLPEVFRRYPSPEALGRALKPEVIAIIRPTGFFNIKADNIIRTAQAIHARFDGRVPEAMEDLLSLPGVGRKSANVIRGACFGKPAIIVDTHFARTVSRLELTDAESPEAIELDLAEKIPGDIQYRFSMLINKHGRDFCQARQPNCPGCPLGDLCRWPKLA